MVVGLTGGIGSGKSTVLSFFSEFEDIAVYIADKEAKLIMNSSEEIKQKLTKEFGENTYKNNLLNRGYLANIVFKNKKKLTVLNNIVHPFVYEHLQSFIQKNLNKRYIVYENAILFENGSNAFCDKVITVVAPEKTRIERVVKRDKTTSEEVKNRMKNQWKDTKKILLSNYIITNTKLSNTKKQVLSIHKKLIHHSGLN